MDDQKRVDVKNLVRDYVSVFPSRVRVESVFLFGSFARGDTRRDSDVDLIVLSKDFDAMNFIERLEFLSRMRQKPSTLETPMDIFGYTPEEFEHLEDESVIIRQAKKEGRFVWRRQDEHHAV